MKCCSATIWRKVPILLLLGCRILFGSVDSKPIATIPFELFGDFIFIKVRVNQSRELNFIFDTGASITVIEEGLKPRLGLKKGAIGRAIGADGERRVEYFPNNRLIAGTLDLEKIALVSTTLKHLNFRIGRSVDGILGYSLLELSPIYIDYQHKRIQVYSVSKNWRPGQQTHEFPVRISPLKLPVVAAQLSLPNGEKLSGEFIFDTGASLNVILNSPFIERNKIVQKFKKSYRFHLFGLTSGWSTNYMGRIAQFIFGPFVFKNIPVACSTAQRGANSLPQFAGVIGNSILKRLNILLDVPNKKLYLTPNTFFNEPFLVNCSGLRLGLNRWSSGIRIYEVIPGSPAARAGLRVYDTLVFVNGNWVEISDLLRIRRMLKTPGKRVTLGIRRIMGIRNFVLRLRELI